MKSHRKHEPTSVETYSERAHIAAIHLDLQTRTTQDDAKEDKPDKRGAPSRIGDV